MQQKSKPSKRKAEEMKRQERETLKRNETILEKWKESLVKPKIPLKCLPQDVQEVAVKQLQNCAPLSATDAPSCCMFKITQVCICLTDLVQKPALHVHVQLSVRASCTIVSCLLLIPTPEPNGKSQVRAAAVDIL